MGWFCHKFLFKPLRRWHCYSTMSRLGHSITLSTEHSLNACFSASSPLTTGGLTLFAQGAVY